VLLPFSLLATWRAVVLVVVNAKLYVPLPDTRGVTSAVTHCLVANGPELPVIAVETAGAFAYVMVFSSHVVSDTLRASNPVSELVNVHSLSVALPTGPVQPLTANLT
jgi:hypothetical protein